MTNDHTGIEWTDATWNPVTGCSKVSEGCRHCYAETISLRMGWSSKPWTHPNARENVILHPDRLSQPLRWTKPRRVFVNSMSDMFHELVPDDYIATTFAVMAASPRHTFQVLTKRPERMQKLLTSRDWPEMIERAGEHLAGDLEWCHLNISDELDLRELPNVWLGTSIEDERVLVDRIVPLIGTPAAVRFLSCEPLLGPLDLAPYLQCEHYSTTGDELRNDEPDELINADIWKCDICGQRAYDEYVNGTRETRSVELTPGHQIDWVIVGGESGEHHRSIDIDWVREIRDDCIATSTPFFFKQWGGRTAKANGRELDGVEWSQMPVPVQNRELVTT